MLDVIEQRIEVLDRLIDGVTDKRRLVESLDCSRSTVDRSIRELESFDFVEQEDGEYRLTTFGRLAVAEYNEFEERVETIKHLKPALEWLPVEEFDLDFGCLADAKLVVSTSNDPYAPANRHADVMAEADSFRGLLPAVGLNQLEAGRDAHARGQEQRLVVEKGVADALRNRTHYAEKVEVMLSSPRVEISVYDGTIPYFLGLYDGTVHIGVEDEDGMPRALIEADAEGVRDWGESTFDRYERQARAFA